MVNIKRLLRPPMGFTTREPRKIPGGRSKPPFCNAGQVPSTPARMKILALVFALSVNLGRVPCTSQYHRPDPGGFISGLLWRQDAQVGL